MADKFILVCITRSGLVSSSSYDTLAAANNAKSIALVGMTLDEVATHDAERERRRQEWDDAERWREPKNDNEAYWASWAAQHGTMSMGNSIFSSDGMVRDGFVSGPSWHPASPGDVVKAVVFEDAGDPDKLDGCHE